MCEEKYRKEVYMYENDKEIIIKAKNGDKEELGKLIDNNNGLIWSIVKRFQGRGYELEDLYQIAVIGFIKAIKRFDTSFEVKLTTYAVPYMIGEVKRFIRDDGPIKISRSIKELGFKIRELQKEYFYKKGRDIKIEEIEKELKVSKEDIILALEATVKPESIEGSNNNINSKNEKTINLIDKLSTDKDEEEIITNKIVLNDLIENLNERDKKVILLRFFKEKTQKQVANVLGITQVQVSRIERRILDSMKLKLSS